MRKNFKIIFVLCIMMCCCSLILASCTDKNSNTTNLTDQTEPDFSQVYAYAQSAGYTGTMEELVALFKGDSAYDIAVKNGFDGTEEEWLSSLHAKEESTSGIKNVKIKDNHLIFTLTDGKEIDAGQLPNYADSQHLYADCYTCHDRTCLTCDYVSKATSEHTLPHAFTNCLSQVCTLCGETVKSTINHRFSNTYTCCTRYCTVCGTYVGPTTKHTFNNNYTCQDRQCTQCGTVVYATTAHQYRDGVCTVCGAENSTPTSTAFTPSDITKLADLRDYSKKSSDYDPSTTIVYDKDTKKYDGKDCREQFNLLDARIEDKYQDVIDGESTSAIVKIFALSDADELLARMAKAVLSFDEMKRLVNYFAGEENADVDSLIRENYTVWSGTLTGTNLKKWVEAGSNGEDPNKGWSFLDDWELFERLKDYADDRSNGLPRSYDDKLNDVTAQDTAVDNATWQFRSILEKFYEEINLSGATVARLATYVFDYAIEIVEEKSGPIEDAVYDVNHTASFTMFCRAKSATSGAAAFNSLGDYDILVYLLSFFSLYQDGGNLANTVRLFGYYYDYVKGYYFGALQDRPTFTKQLEYMKRDTFSNAEWAEYVLIQRNNYVNTYRYSASFYTSFLTEHFNFQQMVETKELMVYGFNKPVSNTSYTGEMKKAIDSSQKGIEGILALTDWIWCYSGNADYVTSYNNANTKYQTGRVGRDTEKKYEGQFYYEMEGVKIIDYLLENMTDTELSGILYVLCYAYSGSMIYTMQTYLKNIQYITDGMEDGETYTFIASDVKSADKDAYAIGKLNVLVNQAKNDRINAEVEVKASYAKSQAWSSMKTEVEEAKEYDYSTVTVTAGSKKGLWEIKCEVLEDRILARDWSCCGQRVSEAKANQCVDGATHGLENADGTVATKDYSVKCKISKFVSNYEDIFYYFAAQTRVKFMAPMDKGGIGYRTNNVQNITYTPGYYGNVETLLTVATTKMSYNDVKTFTISTGKTFREEVWDADEEDNIWWEQNSKTGDNDADYYFAARDFDDEKYGGAPCYTTYTYEFVGWYLDKECKYSFDPQDDVDFDIEVYAGYKVTKTYRTTK